MPSLPRVVQWPSEGIPANPRAWLVNVGRHKAIDRLRRHMRFLAKREQIEAEQMSEHRIGEWIPEEQAADGALQDDVLAAHLHLLPSGACRRKRRSR